MPPYVEEAEVEDDNDPEAKAAFEEDDDDDDDDDDETATAFWFEGLIELELELPACLIASSCLAACLLASITELNLKHIFIYKIWRRCKVLIKQNYQRQ